MIAWPGVSRVSTHTGKVAVAIASLWNMNAETSSFVKYVGDVPVSVEA
jgi:hypothetical protein